MNTKISNYASAISDASYDFYAFTETWLNDDTLSYQIFGLEFDVIRLDRTSANSDKRSGGGVLLAVRSSLQAKQIFPPDCIIPEQIWVAVPFATHVMYICVVYIPPDRTTDANLINQHCNSLSWITTKMDANDCILIIGDFNFPAIRWTKNSSKHLIPHLTPSHTNQLKFQILDDYSLANLGQLNDIVNSHSNILDLCFTSMDSPVNCRLLPAPSPLVKADRYHPPFMLSIDSSVIPFSCNSYSYYSDFRKANFQSMNDFLNSMDWSLFLDESNANLSAESFTDVLLHAIDSFVPKKQCEPPMYPPWSNERLKRLKTSKRSALKKYAKHPTRRLKSRYALANRKYTQLNNRLFIQYQNRVQNRLKHNPKQFWNHVNKQRKESGLPSVMVRDDAEASTPEDICELFRVQFSSVFTHEVLPDSAVLKAAINVPLRTPIGPHPTIDADTVRRACSKLKNSTCCGPDGIPAVVLKKCCDSLAEPLSKLFNISLRSGVFPSCWKKSYVFPVHKKGSKRDVRNYRGISALCAVSKLFEVIVLEFIKFNCCNLIANEQHGFMPKRSTSSNLVTYTTFILRAMEQRKQVDALYTDLSAAFDKINHKIAIAKLQRLGFNGSLLSWLSSYLSKREMLVKIGDVISLAIAIYSGVPQGSHLGPFIYLLYMNDVHDLLKCSKLSYADDIKLFAVIEKPSDALFLQNQLNTFASWCNDNRMVLNASKCSAITFTRKHSTIAYDYTLSNSILSRTDCVKDLGVMLDSKMAFTEHVSYICNKASKTLGFIFRIGKHFRQTHCLKVLYCSLVRSSLEFCSVVWAPFYQNGIQRIESIQRKFVRYAQRHITWPDPMNPPSYETRCNMLGLDQLSIRRDLAKSLFAADLLQARIDCPAVLEILDVNIRRRELRTHYFLRVPRALTNYGRNEPVSCMCRLFNSCSDYFDFHLSRDTIKKLFLNHLKQPLGLQ